MDVAAEIYGCVMSVILNSVSNPPQQWTPYARVGYTWSLDSGV